MWHRRKAGRLARRCAMAVLVVVVAGCTQLGDLLTPAPRAPEEWAALVKEVRAYERGIGFTETKNFVEATREQAAYPFCGYASRWVLPYSYQDPAIIWVESLTQDQCRALAGDDDVFFGEAEAWGEIGTPVTQAMRESKLDRFLYLVIHEDCHDQFDLPYGIEEAVCELITYKAMVAFADAKYGLQAREDREVRRYAETQSRRTRALPEYYAQLEALYGRYARKEITPDALLDGRAAIYRDASGPVGVPASRLNNVRIANGMTYSRHYALIETVFEAQGSDLGRTVAFFRRVDKAKPPRAAIMKRAGVNSEKTLAFVRAYEQAVVETIRKELAGPGR